MTSPPTAPSERRLWMVAATVIVATWGMAFFAQELLDALRERGLLERTVALILLLGAVSATILLSRQRPRRPEWLLLLLGVLTVLLVVRHLEIVQERIHLLEYGLLGGVLYFAFGERARRRGWTGVLWAVAAPAVVTTAAVGWIDEGIQHLLPARIYDLRDVALNAGTGLLMVSFLALRDRLRHEATPSVE